MNYADINPFQELYVTDSPDPNVFVALFSDVLVGNVRPLFLPGHVVVKGTQGSGKSMLLNLLRPEIRCAYSTTGHPFPVDQSATRFIGAGINLTRSGALDIGQRPIGKDIEADLALFPLYFADFLNYFVVRDILRSIEVASSNPDVFIDVVHSQSLDVFARELAEEDCWFGYLSGSTDFRNLCERIDGRISWYRRFHQYNADLPETISSTKTTIGEPIARAAEVAKRARALSADIEVFIRIDQIERLYRSDALRKELGREYRRVINKAIGARDSRVSYKLGTRRYAWEDDLTVFGTDDKLENLRDFRIIDLDELLRRGEDTKTWIFPTFADDAFRRRLAHAGHAVASEERITRRVLGASLAPQEAAETFKKASPESALRTKGIPAAWLALANEVYPQDPLDALLLVAWAKQRAVRKSKQELTQNPPVDGPLPWRGEIWRKERTRQALVQLAARTSQRLKWSGEEQLLALSGGNITVFVSICHEIWDAFFRSERRKAIANRHDFLAQPISRDIQTVAIQTASRFWFEKVAEQPKGEDRQRFVAVLAAQFRKWLIDDESMSYPGWNGFSLTAPDLERLPSLAMFLSDAADYGDLVAVPHTTKERDRLPRTKWYISPILSPHFQIPESHVKEPFYAQLSDVAHWLRRANVDLEGIDQLPPSRQRRRGVFAESLPLFEIADADEE